MNRVVRADHEIGADRSELFCRRQHQATYCRPVAAIDWRHILSEREGVHGHFGMSMPADELRALDANRQVTECRALGGTSDDSDMLHDASVSRRTGSAFTPSRRETARTAVRDDRGRDATPVAGAA